MIKLEIGSAIYLNTNEFWRNDRIRPVARLIIAKIRELMTFSNPLRQLYEEKPEIYPFYRRQPKYVKLYDFLYGGQILELPLGALRPLITLLNEYNIQYKIVDKRVTPEVSEPYEFIGQLFDYQKKAVQMWLYRKAGKPRSLGLLVAPTGSGKTVMGVKLFTMLGMKTLVLAHTREIADQWVHSFEQFSKKKFSGFKPVIGFAHSGKRPKGNEDIVIGLYQTVHKLVDSEPGFTKQFGLVIMDEADLVAAKTLYKIAMRMESKFKKGLTATPERKDGFTFKVKAVLGDVVATVDTDDLQKEERFVPIKVNAIKLNVLPRIVLEQALNKSWTELVSFISESYERNEIITNVVVDSVQRYDMRAIVFVDRVLHAKLLAKMITEEFSSRGIPYKATYLVGELAQNDRKKVLNSEEFKVLVVTKLADRGMDLPELGIAHLVVPTSNKNILVQRVGRVRRMTESKQFAVIYEYIDTGLEFIFYKYHLPYYRDESADISWLNYSNPVLFE